MQCAQDTSVYYYCILPYTTCITAHYCILLLYTVVHYRILLYTIAHYCILLLYTVVHYCILLYTTAHYCILLQEILSYLISFDHHEDWVTEIIPKK